MSSPKSLVMKDYYLLIEHGNLERFKFATLLLHIKSPRRARHNAHIIGIITLQTITYLVLDRNKYITRSRRMNENILKCFNNVTNLQFRQQLNDSNQLKYVKMKTKRKKIQIRRNKFLGQHFKKS